MHNGNARIANDENVKEAKTCRYLPFFSFLSQIYKYATQNEHHYLTSFRATYNPIHDHLVEIIGVILIVYASKVFYTVII